MDIKQQNKKKLDKLFFAQTSRTEKVDAKVDKSENKNKTLKLDKFKFQKLIRFSFLKYLASDHFKF